MYKLNIHKNEKHRHLIDENGNDWYDYVDNNRSNNYKICTNTENLVVSYNIDASMLFPENCNVFEVDEIPNDLSLGLYKFENNKFYKVVNKPQLNNSNIQNRLIYFLMKSFNDLTEDEKIEYLNLKSIFLEQQKK